MMTKGNILEYGVKEEICDYVMTSIIPMYDGFDKGHSREHCEYVVSEALHLSTFYSADPDMVFVAAACHDIGLVKDRATHHLVSEKMILEDRNLERWFTEEQIVTIAHAARDHRASSDREPETIYGRLIAEADRQIVPETVIRRTILYGMDHYPELDREGHWRRMLSHLEEKYSERGYLKLWIKESRNADNLRVLRDMIKDENVLRRIFDETFREV